VPPLWRHVAGLRMVGPHRWLYPAAHHPKYIEEWS